MAPRSRPQEPTHSLDELSDSLAAGDDDRHLGLGDVQPLVEEVNREDDLDLTIAKLPQRIPALFLRGVSPDGE